MSVAPPTKPRILVVCTGNVCRSPYMERVTQQIVDEAWDPGSVEVHSAGTAALAGRGMDPGTEEILRCAGVRTEGFKARQLVKDHVASSALVLTATRAHRGPVASLHPRALRYTFALGDFVHLASSLPDEKMPRTDDPAKWLSEITQGVAQRRGLVSPRDPVEVDVTDPFRRGPEVFAQMSREVDVLRPGLERALGGHRTR